MQKKSFYLIMASVGLFYSGNLTDDAVAFAAAVEARDPVQMEEFVRSHPTSTLVANAIELAASWECLDPNVVEKPLNCGSDNEGKLIRSSYIN